MKLNKKYTFTISKIEAVVAIFGLLAALYSLISMKHHNDILYENIIQRDSLICKLNFSDSLVRSYFDVLIDTSKNIATYSLKPNYINEDLYAISENGRTDTLSSSQLILRYENLVKELVQEMHIAYSQRELPVIHHNAGKADTISINQLCEIVNSNKYTINNLSRQIDSLKTVLRLKDDCLNAIDSIYGVHIDYEHTSSSSSISATICRNHQIDSAMMLLPLFRDYLQYDTRQQSWQVVYSKANSNR